MGTIRGKHCKPSHWGMRALDNHDEGAKCGEDDMEGTLMSILDIIIQWKFPKTVLLLEGEWMVDF